MTERKAIAIGAGISAAFTTAGGGLVAAAATQGLEWGLAVGTVVTLLGASLGAFLTAYKLTGRDTPPPEAGPIIGG